MMNKIPPEKLSTIPTELIKISQDNNAKITKKLIP